MGLYVQLDWWSIEEKIDEILEGTGNRCFRNSEYVWYYDELLTELANAAGDFWNDKETIKNQICFRDIPYKARKYAEEDEETENAAFWFSTVALTLTETDASTLFYREENYGDHEKEREKRLNMLDRLSKKDLLWLVPTVCSLIVRYLEICGAWDAVKGTIDELDSRQAFIKDKDGLREPQAAYL